MEPTDLDDKQSAISDLRERLESALEALSCAETCETEQDFLTNVREAMAETSSPARSSLGLNASSSLARALT